MTISSFPSITADQIAESLLAIPAFLPITVSTGYLAAWFANLHGFRQRSLVERIFWSIPLSLAISTIASVLIGRFLSIAAVVVFFLACAALWLALLGRELLHLRRSGRGWTIGWHPLGNKAMTLALLWIAVVILSLVDLESGNNLSLSIPFFDHAARINWTESILRTGIPPVNPYYWYQHGAAMRNYYFWYVLCAAIAQAAHLTARSVLNASCVWAGFALAALTGLYLKHFLKVKDRLRPQFIIAISLLAVTGLDIFPNLWNLLYLHRTLPGDLEWWSHNQITSWLDSLLWVPHHVASLVCCMIAFLLAWMAANDCRRNCVASVLLISASLASAFGLSIYVLFAFFLVMLAWSLWHMVVEHRYKSTALLAAGGAGSLILLIPYLRDLAHSAPGKAGSGTSLFSFAVREMIPPGFLLDTSAFSHLASGHPNLARNLANLILLAPGYSIELGFFLVVFLIYVVPSWRGRIPLTPARRSLVCIAGVTLVIISFLQSSLLVSNDFGWRGSLLLQFPLLLFGSEVLASWKLAERKDLETVESRNLPHHTPPWLRSIAALALVLGVITTVCQALVLRFYLPLGAASMRSAHDPDADALSHDAYISYLGYAKLNAAIPRDAIVQFNPAVPNSYWANINLAGVDHQVAIAGDRLGCGSELGGDPSGCPAMAAAIDSLFQGATADSARATCRQYGIKYLVARIYDPAWNDRGGWVWTLNPVVSDDEFRALDCGE